MMKRGVYDHALAPKLWRYLADHGAKKYAEEYGGSFDVPTRNLVAQEMADHYRDEIELGNYGAEFRKNPSKKIRSLTSRASPLAKAVYRTRRHRGVSRRLTPAFQQNNMAYYALQVKRGSAWITLAMFPKGEVGKKYAESIGKTYARRYRRKTFRIFWPDEVKENPAPQNPLLGKGTRVEITNTTSKNLGRTGTVQRFIKTRGTYLVYMDDDGVEPEVIEASANHLRGTYKQNPAPRAAFPEREISQAAKLRQDFTGHPSKRGSVVKIPASRVGLAVGPLLGVAYITTRDGKRERYFHEFAPHARPLLAASSDGRSLFLLGGAYRFTDRGIVDARKGRRRKGT